MNKIGKYKNDKSLLKAGKKYLTESKKQFKNEWKIIGQKFEQIEELSDKELLELINIIEKAYFKYDKLSEDFMEIQKQFISKNK